MFSKLLKTADKFLEKFNLRRLKFGTIMVFLHKFGMEESKKAMGNVMEEIKVCNMLHENKNCNCTVFIRYIICYNKQQRNQNFPSSINFFSNCNFLFIDIKSEIFQVKINPSFHVLPTLLKTYNLRLLSVEFKITFLKLAKNKSTTNVCAAIFLSIPFCY